jgi:hypothetical protein
MFSGDQIAQVDNPHPFALPICARFYHTPAR